MAWTIFFLAPSSPRRQRRHSARHRGLSGSPKSAARSPSRCMLLAGLRWRMPPLGLPPPHQGSRRSGCFRMQAISFRRGDPARKRQFSSEFKLTSTFTCRGASKLATAANHLRIKYVGSVYGYPVFVHLELGVVFCFGRFGMSVVKPLAIVLEGGIVLELDEERVSVRIPRHRVVIANVHCLWLRPVLCVHLYSLIATSKRNGLFSGFHFLAAVRYKHQH